MNITWLPPVLAPTEDKTCNLGMCPTYNLCGVWEDRHSNQLSRPRGHCY